MRCTDDAAPSAQLCGAAVSLCLSAGSCGSAPPPRPRTSTPRVSALRCELPPNAPRRCRRPATCHKDADTAACLAQTTWPCAHQVLRAPAAPARPRARCSTERRAAAFATGVVGAASHLQRARGGPGADAAADAQRQRAGAPQPQRARGGVRQGGAAWPLAQSAAQPQQRKSRQKRAGRAPPAQGGRRGHRLGVAAVASALQLQLHLRFFFRRCLADLGPTGALLRTRRALPTHSLLPRLFPVVRVRAASSANHA